MSEPRKWWVAGLLSLIQPGIGQIYNGQLNKGIFIILLGYCYIPLLYFVAFYGLSVLSLLSLIVIGAAYYIFVITDSIVVAKTTL
jgi:signal peptidase I